MNVGLAIIAIGSFLFLFLYGPQLLTFFNFQQPVYIFQHTTNPKIRWIHKPLTVYIDSSTTNKPSFVTDVRNEMNAWTNANSTLVDFQELSSNTNPDIYIKWVPSISGGSDELGNTNYTYVDTGEFWVIYHVEIDLLEKFNNYQLTDTDLSNIAEHELGHALALQHNLTNTNDVMYPSIHLPTTSVVPISTWDIQSLANDYSDPLLPDLRFYSVIANKYTTEGNGKNTTYFNITFIVENSGLASSSPTKYRIYVDNQSASEANLPGFQIGQGEQIKYQSLAVSPNATNLEIQLDPYNTVNELNKTNNYAFMAVT